MKKKISPWLAAAATAVFISITAAGGTKVYADELDNKGETVVSTTQEDNADEDYDTVTPEVENEEVADEVTSEAENEEADTVTPEVENEVAADTVTPEVENEEAADIVTPEAENEVAADTVTPEAENEVAADTVTPEAVNEVAADTVTPEVKEEENIVTEAPEVKSDIKDADKSKQEIVKDKESEEFAAVVTNNESEMAKPKGWVKDGDNWKYYFGTGEDQYYKNGIQKVGNESYYFDSVGNMKTGWIKDKDNNYYYAYNSGRLAQGWVNDNDKWYFLGYYTLNTDEGKWEIAEDAFVMQSNKIMKDYANPSSKANYFFTSSGAMSTGWAKDKEEYWFHSNSQGILDQGWKQIDGKYYYFGCYNDKLGRIIGFDMLRGGREIEGADYYFSESGVMQTGWINGNNYRSAGCVSVANYAYANPSGRLAQGWKQIDNKWYYFATYELDKKSYHMYADNIYMVGDKYYRFDKDGAMICQVGTDLQDME